MDSSQKVLQKQRNLLVGELLSKKKHLIQEEGLEQEDPFWCEPQ